MYFEMWPSTFCPLIVTTVIREVLRPHFTEQMVGGFGNRNQEKTGPRFNTGATDLAIKGTVVRNVIRILKLHFS